MLASSSCGQPCCACQRRFGSQIASARRGARPEPTAAREPPAAVEKAADDERAEKEQHELLVLEPDAGDEADEQPLSLVAAAEEPRHEVDERHPEEQVEGRRREEMPDRHRGPGRSGRERSDRLSRTSGAELPRDHRDEHHDERDRDRRDDAQPARRLAEQPLREAPEQRRQRRLVVVPPGWVPRGDAEVQLVAVVAVAVRRRDEQQQFGGRDREDKRPRDSRAPSTTHDRPTVLTETCRICEPHPC